MVRETGLEPVCLSAADFKSAEYTISPLSQNTNFTFLKNSAVISSVCINYTVFLSVCQQVFKNIFGAQAKNRTLIAVVPRQCTTIVLQEHFCVITRNQI